MAENTYSQIHSIKNVDIVSDLGRADPDNYAILVKGEKKVMNVRLNKQVKIYTDGPISTSNEPPTNPPVPPIPEEPDPIIPEEPEVINPGEVYMLYDNEIDSEKNERKFVLTVNGEGLKSEIQENGQLKWTIPAGTQLVELPVEEGEESKYGLSIEGTWGFPVSMTDEIIDSYRYLGIEYNLSYTEGFYGIVNYTNSEDTATILISVDTEDGLGGLWTISFEKRPEFINIKIFIESTSPEFVLTEDQYFTLANLALIPEQGSGDET